MKFFTKMMDAFHPGSAFFGGLLGIVSVVWSQHLSSLPTQKIEEEMIKVFSTQMDEKFALKLATCLSGPVSKASDGCSVDEEDLLGSMQRCISSDQLRNLEANQALQLCVLKIKSGRI